jgi:hypothetical protein
MQVKRRVTHTLFFIGYRFNGVDSKIVHISTHVPYDCGSSNKNGLRAAEISRPPPWSSSPGDGDPDRLMQDDRIKFFSVRGETPAYDYSDD